MRRPALALGLLCLAGVAVAFTLPGSRGRCAPGGRECRRAPAVAAAAALTRDVDRASATTTAPGVTPTLHYAPNVRGRVPLAASLGFDLFDVLGNKTHPTRVRAAVAALPAGSKALVWVGNLDNAPLGSSCPPPGFTFARFAAQVKALAHNRRVFGYYLADEPHPSVCPNAARDIRRRADYIHAHAPGQRAFIVVLDGYALCGTDLGCEYRLLQPYFTDVDYFGLDPYPCHYDPSGNSVPCDDSMITAHVAAAEGNGIPPSAIVPVFQTFGQEGRTDGKPAYYRLPTPDELQALFAVWASVVPDPAFDYSYTFGPQCTALSCPAPQAIAVEPSIQAVVSAHNTGG